jgi:hypothetical protein
MNRAVIISQIISLPPALQGWLMLANSILLDVADRFNLLELHVCILTVLLA